jgi:TM2 domain-containing membrane protein YozV
MKKILTLIILSLFILPLNLSAENYKLDQSKIDAKFSAATEITLSAALDISGFQGANQVLNEKDPVIAFVLATVLGYLGIHRAYLGTTPVVVILYIITAGGCGIITLIDWIMLLMVLIDEKDLGPYIDNPSFLMWKNNM